MADTPLSERMPAPGPPLPKRRRVWKRLAIVAGVLLVGWLVIAYVALPMFWMRYTRQHPALADIPNITHTADGIPGDPLNVALIGTEAGLKRIMLAARWYPADPLTLRSRLEIASAAVFEHPYDDAPVSNLYLWGRKEDLAFEQPVGNDPRQRHHVRFWLSDKRDADGRPVWVGAAIFDQRVGLSHTTGQITHHTAPDIDAERDTLFSDLKRTGDLAEVFFVDDFHPVRQGRNGGGDPWFTDGRLEVGVIRAK
jgi:LssY C-terminus